MDDPPQQPMSFESAMKHFATVSAALALALSLSGCIGPPLALTPQTEQRLKTEAPIRFLLTFDDGPTRLGLHEPHAVR